jgi:hypothetical protein
MSVDLLLSKLEKVKRTGPDRWIACCPAHDDKRPSLAIREAEDGRILVHCFADCPVESVLAAVGLEFDALFPPNPIEHAKRERRPFNAHDVLECLSQELLLLSIASGDMSQGLPVSETDHERLILAATRIESARRLANGER